MQNDKERQTTVRRLGTVCMALLVYLSFSAFALSQDGTIKGRITDAQTGEPLFGVTVIVEDIFYEEMTDENGEFIINDVPVGTYSVTTEHYSYEPVTREGIVIRANEISELTLELESESIGLSTAEIVVRINRESETALLLDQRKSIVASQSIGAQELSRKGVGDAEGAVAKVSGVSKQDGVKNVFVRGLGDRYNATLLNGLPIPSEDPEYKNIALSFFGTDVIQNIGVNKVFSAGNTGDAAGAIIDITSKELFNSSAFGLDFSAGFNTNIKGVDFLKADGVNSFGFAKKDRPTAGKFDFVNRLDPSVAKLPINQSFKLSGGKKFRIGNNPLSFFMVASQSSDYSYSEEIVRNMNTAGIIYQDQTGKKYSQNISQLVLGNLNYGFGNKNSIAYNFMMLHASDQYVGEYSGKHSEKHQDGDQDMGYLRRQQINDNLLMTHQLLTQWTLTNRLDLRINGSYNSIKGYEPDRRENYLSRKSDGTYGLTGSNRQKRFFSELSENNYNAQAILDLKLNDATNSGNSKISVGYNAYLSDNDFEAVEYNFSAIPGAWSIDNIRLDELYNQQNYNQGLFSMSEGSPNSYSVNKNIQSAFAEATYQFSKRFSANAGLRIDHVDMDVEYDVPGRADKSNSIQKSYYLPSLNLKYDFNDKNALRLGASKTYTLPQSKEISPYQYVNIGFASEGNPNLKPSDNYNFDLKWDFYLSNAELLSVGAFYKRIENPIGRVDKGNSAGLLTYDNISDFANVTGAEVELRKNIYSRESESGNQHKLSFGLNASFLYTDLLLKLENTPERSSGLEGAAPFIANSDLTYYYSNQKHNWTSSLVFNYFSDRIYTNGTLGFEDIIEEGVPTLDFVSSFNFNKKISLKFKASNLLNPNFSLTRESSLTGEKIILNRYKKGIDLSLGIGLEL